MDKLSALVEIKALVEKDLLKYSEFDLISNVVNGVDKKPESINAVKTKLYALVDEKVISTEVFEACKPSLIVTQTPKTPITPSYSHSTVRYNDATIKGKGLGFLLGFFLSVIGLILALTLGDEECKEGAKKGFIIEIAIGIVVGVLYGIIACAIATRIASDPSYGPTYPYIIQFLTSLFCL